MKDTFVRVGLKLKVSKVRRDTFAYYSNRERVAKKMETRGFGMHDSPRIKPNFRIPTYRTFNRGSNSERAIRTYPNRNLTRSPWLARERFPNRFSDFDDFESCRNTMAIAIAAIANRDNIVAKGVGRKCVSGEGKHVEMRDDETFAKV